MIPRDTRPLAATTAPALAITIAISVFVTAGVGCSKGATPAAQGAGAPSTRGSEATGLARADGSGSASPSAHPGADTERSWRDAADGDPLELARLAHAEGADSLAEVAADTHASDERRATALRALAFVDDPTPALAVLTAAIPTLPVERSTLALQTLAQVAAVRRPIEEVEPGAWRACGEAVAKSLESLGGVKDPTRRELAIRVLLGLADRGAFSYEAIPAR